MKHIFIKSHSDKCNLSPVNYCASTFVCYVNNEFYLITYNTCEYQYYAQPETVEIIIKAIIGELQIEVINTHRSVRISAYSKQELAEAFTEGFVTVHHFIYHNNFHGFLSIASEIAYCTSFLIDEDVYYAKYKKAEQVLKEKGLCYLNNDLKLLMRHNLPQYTDERIIISSINDISKTILKIQQDEVN